MRSRPKFLNRVPKASRERVERKLAAIVVNIVLYNGLYFPSRCFRVPGRKRIGGQPAESGIFG